MKMKLNEIKLNYLLKKKIKNIKKKKIKKIKKKKIVKLIIIFQKKK